MAFDCLYLIASLTTVYVIRLTNNRFVFQEVIRQKSWDLPANQEIDGICSRAGGDVPHVLLQGLSVTKVVLVNLETLICNLCRPLALRKIT